jgi:hypothetical protein
MQNADETLLEARLRGLNQLHVEEASELVRARDTDRHPDGHAYGVQVVESMKQTLQPLLHLPNKTGALRRKAFDWKRAREALKLVHSDEYTEKILVCIGQAEELATKIVFVQNLGFGAG